MATVKEQVQQIYVGLLGRAADKNGLDYWVDQIESGNMTIEEVRSNAVNEQPEGQAIYDSGKSREEIVTALYENLFEKTPDTEGLEYWVNGEGADVNADQLVLALINGAGEADAQVLANKVEAAQYYTDNAGESGEEFRDDARAAVENVDGTSESVAASKAATDDLDQQPQEPSVPGETIMLTEGRDVEVGTADDDTFVGLTGQNQDGALSNAFSTGDYVNGGAGRDKIIASLMEDQEVDSGVDATINPRTDNVEEVYLEALDNVTVDAGRMNSVEQYWSDNSAGDLNLNDVRLGDKLAITKDVTFGMRDVDTGSSLYAAFDTNSLTKEAANTINSRISIKVADSEAQDLAAPISNVAVDLQFNIEEDGEITTVLLQDIVSADGTYEGLRTAVDEALEAEGYAEFEVAFGESTRVIQTENDTVNLRYNLQEVVVTDPEGRAISEVKSKIGQSDFVDEDSNPVSTIKAFDPDTTSTMIETNVVLDNAGRGSTAGDVVIGGMSNSGQTIEKLNLVVDRDSKVDDITSASGMSDGLGEGESASFEQIVVTSGEAQGDLSIGGFNGTADIDSYNNIALDGVGDAKLFDATAFQGENLAVAGSAVTEGNYAYNTADSNDTVVLGYNAGSVDSVNTGITISTQGGNDTVTLNQAGGTSSEFANQLAMQNIQVSTASGEDTVNIGDDLSATVVDAGSNDDYVQVSDSTVTNTAQWMFNADPSLASGDVGRGNQQFQLFNAKLQVEFQGVTSDVVEINFADYVTTSRDINEAIKTAIMEDDQLSKLLSVSDLKNEGLQIDSLIHRELAADALNVNFIAPTYEPNDSDNQDAGFDGDAGTLFAERGSVTEQELENAWETYYPNSEGIGQGSGTGIYNSVGTASDMYDALFGALDYNTGGNLAGYNKVQNETGADTDEVTINVINGGTGNDVIVLSSNWDDGAAYDVVKVEGNFGYDTVMNFNTGTATGAGVADQVDFTSYLDAAAAGRGASVVADDRVDQQVGYTFTNGVNPNATATLAANSINHNAVVMTGISELYADFDATPASFDGINAEMVENALAANQGWVDDGGATDENMVGSTFVFRVARDAQIETDANGDSQLGDFVDAQKEKVYTVTIGWDADASEFTFTAAERGTIEYGDMFSTLADVEAKSVTGTTEAVAEAAKADTAIEDALNPVYTVAEASGMTADTFNLEDTAAALGSGGNTLDDAVNITATDAATVGQAEAIADAENSGTTSFDVADSLSSLEAVADNDTAASKNGLAEAGTITVNAGIAAGEEEVTFDNLTADSAGTTIDFADDAVTLTAEEYNGLTLATAAGDAITITMEDVAVTGGASDDTFDYAGSETGANITDFGTAGTDVIDLIDVNAATSLTDMAGNVAMADNAVFFLGGQSAGSADADSSAATALSAAFNDDVDMAGSFVVIADDDSSAIYAVSNTGADGNGIVAGDLTLVGTVDAVLAETDISVA